MPARMIYLAIFVIVFLVTAGCGIVGSSVWNARNCAIPHRADAFVAYCNDPALGHYEHGALYYGLEPAAIANLRAADVLILGNSRAQFAFSTDAVSRYFESRNIKYFVLGFGHGEMSDLPAAIMLKYGANPKVIIANADPFFSHQRSEMAEQLLHGSISVRLKYVLKGVTLDAFASICSIAPSLCGSPASFVYRSSVNGFWMPMRFPLDRAIAFHPSAEPFDQNLIDLWSKAGLEFLQATGIDRDCVILTGVPAPNYATAALASGLGKLMDVGVLNVSVPLMNTFDNAHLNVETAQRWSEAFLGRANSMIEKCLARR
jgi:hypothetical protein